MKPIPEALRAYFPDKVHPDRPWWLFRFRDEGMATVFAFERPDGYGTDLLSDREEIDRAHPMQPPPILVGQVWALQVPGSPLRVGTVTHTWQDTIVTVGISGFGMNLRGDLLLESGFLLSCPYGYAPWSGPQVPK